MNKVKMRVWLVALMVVALACRIPTSVGAPARRTPVPPTATPTLTPAAPSATPSPTATSTPRPTFTPTPSPTSTPTPEPVLDPQLTLEGVDIFPWPLYHGDELSVDVDPLLPDSTMGDTNDMEIRLEVNGDSFDAPVRVSGLSEEAQARFYWITEVPTDATSLTVTATLELSKGITDTNPANNVVTLELPVRPLAASAPPEPGAQWVMTETTGFNLHYVTGSAAERDLVKILATAEAAYAHVSDRLGTSDEAVDIYLLDRVIGQGGYASPDWVAISYTDRGYTPVMLDSLLRHELTHRLDDEIGCDRAPSVMREGLAVYVAGGHYRQEPLRRKAAALLSTTHYVPLTDVVENFYRHQHEVGYLEAAALVQFVVDTQGWETFIEMCDAASDRDDSDAERMQAAVEVLDLASVAELEHVWQRWLDGASPTARDVRLLELELRLMDAMRAYQASYDEPAHFIEGLLFSPAEAARMGIVADFVRRPRSAEAIAFELLLAMAQEAIESQDTALVALLVEEIERGLAEGLDAADLVADAVGITQLALARDLEPYRLVLEDDHRYRVYALDRRNWPEQRMVTATRSAQAWELSAVGAVE